MIYCEGKKVHMSIFFRPNEGKCRLENRVRLSRRKIYTFYFGGDR